MNKFFTKIASAVLGLAMAVGVGAVVAGNLKEVKVAEAAEETATLSFANKAQRTSFSNTQQVWKQNGITFTNDKASSTNNVADYANPARLYANSKVTVEAPGKITKILFDANNSSYATALKNSIGNTATASSDKVTVDLDGTSNSYVIAKLTAQVRIDSLSVTYKEASGGGDDGGNTPVTTYKVTYDANGGTGSVVDYNSYDSGATVTVLSGNGFSYENHEFYGWNTKSDGTGDPYFEDDTFNINSDTTLYAQWEELTSTDSYYTLLDNIENLKIEDQIIIVAKDYNYAMSTDQKDNNRGQVEISRSGDNINSVSNTVQVFTLKAGKTSGSYAFYTGSGYICAASSSSNYLKTETTLSNNSSWSISIASDGTATIKAQGTNTRNVLQYNQSSSLFACYSSASQKAVTIYKYVSLEESISISSETLNGYNGTTDNSIKISTVNFNATESDISISYSVDGIATISSSIVNDIITLATTFNNEGLTVATIKVKEHEVTLSITVEKKPIELEGTNSDIKDGVLEVISDGSKTKQITFKVLYEDDDSYTKVNAKDSILINNPDASSVSATNNGETVVIKGLKANTEPVTLTFTLKTNIALETPLTYELKVKVTDDYNRYVEIAFNKNLTATQGDCVNIQEVFKTKQAKTYFSNYVEIKDDELLFSYEKNDRENAVGYQDFIYDFEHGDILDSTHKLQEVWVYVNLNENFEEVSYPITVEQKTVELESISLNAEELLLIPFETFQLDVTYNPTNTTVNREVIYSIDEEISDSGHSVTVSDEGLISVGNKIGLCAIVRVESVYNPEIYAEVCVEVIREAITLKVEGKQIFEKVKSTDELTDGKYLIVSEASNVAFDGSLNTLDATSNNVSLAIDGSEIAYTEELANVTFTIAKNGDVYSIKSSSGKYIGSDGTKNELDSSNTSLNNTITFEEDGVKIVGTGGNVLRYNDNSGQERFRYFKSDTYTNQKAIQLYKLSGNGLMDVEVTDDLYDILDRTMIYNEASSKYQLELCDITGKTSLDGSEWDAIADLFSETTAASDNQLAYARADENGNIAEQFLAAYDYVVTKYGESYDFLGRIDSGLILSSNSGISYLSRFTENNSSAIIIVTISLISVISLGGYFFLKKRKEQ